MKMVLKTHGTSGKVLGSPMHLETTWFKKLRCDLEQYSHHAMSHFPWRELYKQVFTWISFKDSNLSRSQMPFL